MGKRSFSQPSARLTSQIESVLQVSVRLLAVALTCLVTLKPKKLYKEILMAMTMPDQRTLGVLTNWYQPLGRSKKGELEAIDGIARMGMHMMMVSAPNKPS